MLHLRNQLFHHKPLQIVFAQFRHRVCVDTECKVQKENVRQFAVATDPARSQAFDAHSRTWQYQLAQARRLW